jgi:MFS family permease
MRTRAFWLLIGVVLLMSSCLQGLVIHAAPYLSDLGLAANGLALFLAAQGLVGVVGRVGAGFLFDRFFPPRISLGIFGVGVTSAFLLATTHNMAVALVAMLAVIIGGGAESDLVGLLVGRYFGLRAYGQLFGYIYGAFMVGIAFGPYLFGVAFDQFGSYQVPFALGGIGIAIMCGLLLMMPPFPPPWRHDVLTK